MGGSYGHDVAYSTWPNEDRAKLAEALRMIREVVSSLMDMANEEGQYDNAAQTGGLAGELGMVAAMLEYAVPALTKKEPDRA